MTVKKMNIKKLGIAVGIILLIILLVAFSIKKYVDDKK